MHGDLKLRLCAAGLVAAGAAAVFLATTPPASAADQVHDEIEVYNAEIAEVGQWTYEQHFNYAWRGQTQPEFPGGFTSNHSLQGTPEFAYGITDWWEGGFYLPFAVTGSGEFLSDGAKIRSLFVVPDAAKRSFFYGVNFELGYEMPQFSLTPWNLEIRPIIGVRNKEWEFIVNPIVDVGFGESGEADFAPALRLARNLGEDRFIGLEYYADFGKIGDFLPLAQQSQQLFAVTDFKVNTVDVELGVGYGFTPGSDGLVIKAIIGYAFPVPGKSDDGGSSPNTPLAMGTSARPSPNALIMK
jgi:opacity protein-like surface antigen